MSASQTVVLLSLLAGVFGIMISIIFYKFVLHRLANWTAQFRQNRQAKRREKRVLEQSSPVSLEGKKRSPTSRYNMLASLSKASKSKYHHHPNTQFSNAEQFQPTVPRNNLITQALHSSSSCVIASPPALFPAIAQNSGVSQLHPFVSLALPTLQGPNVSCTSNNTCTNCGHSNFPNATVVAPAWMILNPGLAHNPGTAPVAYACAVPLLSSHVVSLSNGERCIPINNLPVQNSAAVPAASGYCGHSPNEETGLHDDDHCDPYAAWFQDNDGVQAGRQSHPQSPHTAREIINLPYSYPATCCHHCHPASGGIGPVYKSAEGLGNNQVSSQQGFSTIRSGRQSTRGFSRPSKPSITTLSSCATPRELSQCGTVFNLTSEPGS